VMDVYVCVYWNAVTLRNVSFRWTVRVCDTRSTVFNGQCGYDSRKTLCFALASLLCPWPVLL
jgi:hypothetical protein